jgi:hypothetical protein
MADYPVVVSITSLPSRIGRIRPCLESLLSGSMIPDKILLPLPNFSEREHLAYTLPNFLGRDDFFSPIVEVVPVDRDWGPGTKLLGALTAIQHPCYLVLADDDVRYKLRFLEGIVRAQEQDHFASFSYYTPTMDGFTIGQGCDGFSFWSPNILDIAPFAEKHVYETNLFFHDDFWISFFLASKGIPIKSLNQLLRNYGGRIYEIEYTEENSLHLLKGSLSKRTLQREGLKRLLREVDMPIGRRLRLIADYAIDRIFTQPFRQVRGLLRKIILERVQTE